MENFCGESSLKLATWKISKNLGVDGTGSELCPMVGIGISSVERSGSSTRDLVC
jgi:hypothetical protein